MSTITAVAACTYQTARRARGRKVQAIGPKLELCWTPGCFRRADVECYLPDNESGKPDEYHCQEHVHSAGYCWGCGLFWAGVESFDFSRNGLCDNCRYSSDITGEWDDERDYDEDDYDYAYSRWAGYPDDYDPSGGDIPF